MIDVITIWDDTTKDTINKWGSGYMSIDMFNRLSKRAELSIIDWLSGDVAGLQPPEPWSTQKNRDWLSPFITKSQQQVIKGYIERPPDYYLYDNFSRVGSTLVNDCDEEPDPDECDTPITVLAGDKFNQRCITYIKDKKPSYKKPIGKIAGELIEVRPKDLGVVTLEYVRYPKFAQLGKTFDTTYNEEVPDPNNSSNYEWGEWARPVLVWYITNYFADHTRERALKEFNNATGKTARG